MSNVNLLTDAGTAVFKALQSQASAGFDLFFKSDAIGIGVSGGNTNGRSHNGYVNLFNQTIIGWSASPQNYVLDTMSSVTRIVGALTDINYGRSITLVRKYFSNGADALFATAPSSLAPANTGLYLTSAPFPPGTTIDTSSLALSKSAKVTSSAGAFDNNAHVGAGNLRGNLNGAEEAIVSDPANNNIVVFSGGVNALTPGTSSTLVSLTSSQVLQFSLDAAPGDWFVDSIPTAPNHKLVVGRPSANNGQGTVHICDLKPALVTPRAVNTATDCQVLTGDTQQNPGITDQNGSRCGSGTGYGTLNGKPVFLMACEGEWVNGNPYQGVLQIYDMTSGSPVLQAIINGSGSYNQLSQGAIIGNFKDGQDGILIGQSEATIAGRYGVGNLIFIPSRLLQGQATVDLSDLTILSQCTQYVGDFSIAEQNGYRVVTGTASDGKGIFFSGAFTAGSSGQGAVYAAIGTPAPNSSSPYSSSSQRLSSSSAPFSSSSAPFSSSSAPFSSSSVPFSSSSALFSSSSALVSSSVAVSSSLAIATAVSSSSFVGASSSSALAIASSSSAAAVSSSAAAVSSSAAAVSSSAAAVSSSAAAGSSSVVASSSAAAVSSSAAAVSSSAAAASSSSGAAIIGGASSTAADVAVAAAGSNVGLIIGLCAAAVAACVLAYLIYRHCKKKDHHRKLRKGFRGMEEHEEGTIRPKDGEDLRLDEFRDPEDGGQGDTNQPLRNYQNADDVESQSRKGLQAAGSNKKKGQPENINLVSVNVALVGGKANPNEGENETHEGDGGPNDDAQQPPSPAAAGQDEIKNPSNGNTLQAIPDVDPDAVTIVLDADGQAVLAPRALVRTVTQGPYGIAKSVVVEAILARYGNLQKQDNKYPAHYVGELETILEAVPISQHYITKMNRDVLELYALEIALIVEHTIDKQSGSVSKKSKAAKLGKTDLTDKKLQIVQAIQHAIRVFEADTDGMARITIGLGDNQKIIYVDTQKKDLSPLPAPASVQSDQKREQPGSAQQSSRSPQLSPASGSQRAGSPSPASPSSSQQKLKQVELVDEQVDEAVQEAKVNITYTYEDFVKEITDTLLNSHGLSVKSDEKTHINAKINSILHAASPCPPNLTTVSARFNKIKDEDDEKRTQVNLIREDVLNAFQKVFPGSVATFFKGKHHKFSLANLRLVKNQQELIKELQKTDFFGMVISSEKAEFNSEVDEQQQHPSDKSHNSKKPLHGNQFHSSSVSGRPRSQKSGVSGVSFKLNDGEQGGEPSVSGQHPSSRRSAAVSPQDLAFQDGGGNSDDPYYDNDDPQSGAANNGETEPSKSKSAQKPVPARLTSLDDEGSQHVAQRMQKARTENDEQGQRDKLTKEKFKRLGATAEQDDADQEPQHSGGVDDMPASPAPAQAQNAAASQAQLAEAQRAKAQAEKDKRELELKKELERKAAQEAELKRQLEDQEARLMELKNETDAHRDAERLANEAKKEADRVAEEEKRKAQEERRKSRRLQDDNILLKQRISIHENPHSGDGSSRSASPIPGDGGGRKSPGRGSPTGSPPGSPRAPAVGGKSSSSATMRNLGPGGPSLTESMGPGGNEDLQATVEAARKLIKTAPSATGSASSSSSATSIMLSLNSASSSNASSPRSLSPVPSSGDGHSMSSASSAGPSSHAASPAHSSAGSSAGPLGRQPIKWGRAADSFFQQQYEDSQAEQAQASANRQQPQQQPSQPAPTPSFLS